MSQKTCTYCHKNPPVHGLRSCFDCTPEVERERRQDARAYQILYYEVVIRPTLGWKRRYRRKD